MMDVTGRDGWAVPFRIYALAFMTSWALKVEPDQRDIVTRVSVGVITL